MQKIIRGYPPEQGYSDRDETQTTGLSAAREGEMLFMLHTWEVYVLKKENGVYIVFITGSRHSGSAPASAAAPALVVEKFPRILRHNWSHILLAGLAGLAR